MRSLQLRVPAGSIRGRITVVYAFVVVLAVIVMIALAYVWVATQLRTAMVRDLQDRIIDLSRVRSYDVTADPYAQLIVDGLVTSHSLTAPNTPVLTGKALDEALHGQAITERVPGLPGRSMVAAQRTGTGTTLIVAASLDPFDAATSRVLGGLLPAGLVLAVGSVFVVRRLVDAALHPVAALTREAAAISAEVAPRRLAVPHGSDEIANLSRTLNVMLDRMDAALRRERTFVDDAAHELRTPVAVLRGELELGLAAPDLDSARASLRAGLLAADRLGRLSTDLLVLSRASAGQLYLRRQPCDVTAEIRDSAARIGEMTGIMVKVTGEEIVASLDAVRLEQVVGNLLTNAAYAGAGTVRIAVHPGPADGVVLVVDDDGPGFPSDVLPVAFDRLNRLRGARERARQGGFGIGLAIVAAIARAHGGSASASNDSSLGGARIRVSLPGADLMNAEVTVTNITFG